MPSAGQVPTDFRALTCAASYREDEISVLLLWKKKKKKSRISLIAGCYDHQFRKEVETDGDPWQKGLLCLSITHTEPHKLGEGSFLDHMLANSEKSNFKRVFCCIKFYLCLNFQEF